jgi:hypothetical protein
MHWINDDAAAKQLLLEAGTCRFIDSRRYTTTLEVLSFESAGTCTPEFAGLVQALLSLSNDNAAHYMVLYPHPVTYFHQHFGKYPILSLQKGDLAESYIALLNEDPGGSPADAVGINCYEWVILPESHKWFVHCLRDWYSFGGHLWLPASWIEQVKDSRPWLDYPAQSSSINF